MSTRLCLSLGWEPLCEPNFLCVSVLRVASGPRVKLASCKSAFRTLFDLRFFGFVCFLFLLVSGKSCGLWLWHSLDFSLNCFLFFCCCFFFCNRFGKLGRWFYIRKTSFKAPPHYGFIIGRFRAMKDSVTAPLCLLILSLLVVLFRLDAVLCCVFHGWVMCVMFFPVYLYLSFIYSIYTIHI